MKKWLLLFIPILILSSCAAQGAPEYQKGMIRYGDRWVTKEEYAQIESGQQATESQPSLAPTVPQPSTPSSPAPAPTKTSYAPIVLRGAGSKTTAPFTVPTDEWIIEWHYTPEGENDVNDFSFFIYPRGETAVYSVASLFSKDSGSTYSYAGAGEYYLVVSPIGQGDWTITIRPQ